MSRAARALLVSAGLSAGTIGAFSGEVGATTPPVPPPSAVASTVPAVVGAAPPTTAVVVPPAGSRGGAVEGSVAKPVNDPWSPRRIATMTALAVVALAALGYAYGKLRSAPPRHPDLLRKPPDLDGAERVEA